MKLNVPNRQPPVFTHEGAPAALHVKPADQLRRAVMACLLWEDQFYESGQQIADRIKALVAQVDPTTCMEIAVEARHQMKLRHAPLLVVREMARLPEHKALVAHALELVIDRADELTEFLAIYWKDGNHQPLSAQVKKGLARAFEKFGAYDLAKYNRDGAVKLRDVLFLSHAKPGDANADAGKYTKAHRKLERNFPASDNMARVLSPREELYRQLAQDELPTPDTWEVALSGGADKRETFERLLREKKLGALALLRNLRNMAESGVDATLVTEALHGMATERVLPFRFIAAARAVPQWEPYIEPAMLRCASARGLINGLNGRTIVLVDVSGSMNDRLSAKSDLSRLDAACGLAILAREMCAAFSVFSFSDQLVQVPPRRGFALRDAIVQSQYHNGTRLGGAVQAINAQVPHDRLIVLTDEQSHDPVPAPAREGWMINVASAQHGVGYGPWQRVDGWSEAVFDYIIARSAEAP